ncbi:MAG: transglycosylase SLT domain-containing protein [Desulfobacteraceae bacterium]|nr:transglycosylase SLT domain-containing protein [Desulfobacteraceae bacterium]
MVISVKRLFRTGMIIGITTGIFLSFISLTWASTRQSKIDPFPTYPSIAPNVAFWTDIFTRYSRSQGVIHDTRNLGRIYEVIALDPSQTNTAAKKNKKTKKRILEQYEKILLSLATGRPPATSKEKQTAKLFGNKATPKDFKQAARRLRCQTGLSQEFKEGLIRSGAVIEQFKQIFQSHNLPTDLAYLPCVESSFDFTAYSKFGAAGIWQFTRGTGRKYMKIGYVVDQRRDPYISTQAAARHLKINHEKLGSWPLAITAYNHGVNGMLRAQKQKGNYEKIFNTYHGPSFKFASRNFYSEFIAARQVAKNYEYYFGDLSFQEPVQFTRFTTKGYLPAKALTQGLNLEIKTIQTMNPSLRTPVFTGRKHIPKGFELRLPKRITHKTITRVITDQYQARQKPSKFHLVRKGDTASYIARTHTVSLNDLIMANGLSRRATIYIGQNLRIPVQGEVVPTKSSRTKASSKTSSIPKTTSSLPLADNAGKEAKPVSKEPIINLEIVISDLKIRKTITQSNQMVGIIQVAPEETLGHYADWLQIPTQKIRALNQFAYGKHISINQKIQIPLAQKDKDRFEELRYEYHKEMEEDFFASFSIDGVDTYEIKNGDTIWFLCLNKLEIPLWLLQKYNPVMNLNKLQPKARIKYPIINNRLGIKI